MHQLGVTTEVKNLHSVMYNSLGVKPEVKNRGEELDVLHNNGSKNRGHGA
jgi:hypothetical protein